MSIRRHLVAASLAATLAVALGACSDETDGPGESTAVDTAPSSRAVEDDAATSSAAPGASTSPEVELGTFYPAPADLARPEPAPVASVSSDSGHTFDLTGVHRLADDRVVVAGLLTLKQGENAGFDAAEWEEVGYSDYARGDGLQFTPFRLTADADETIYLPVRDADDACLCSVIRPGFQSRGGSLAVMTVMSAPADAQTVTLEMDGYGELADVPVTEVPSTSTTPWGLNEVLAVQSASRQGGTVTARVTLATTAGRPGSGTGMGVFNFGGAPTCFAGVVATGAGPLGGHTDASGCTPLLLPDEGEAVDLEITMPDPGTDQVVLLPWVGHPVAVDVSGTPSKGSGDLLVEYASRSETEGATVDLGEQVTVSLDTSVLFEFDKSELTPQARETLAVAVETLQAQDGRSLTVDGHTDGQGEAAYNKQLSLARAEAVRDALAQMLGSGWTFTVNGYGQEQLAAAEKGTPEDVEAAQARNRRVEITIDQ